MQIANILFSNPTVNYCETASGGIVARPGYAISNLALIAIGLLLIAKKDKLALKFGILSVLAGLMSLLYDVFYTFINQLFDLLAMATFAIFILNLNLKRLKSKYTLDLKLKIVLLVAFGFLIFFIKGMTGNVIFAFLIVLIALTEILFARQTRITKHDYILWLIALSLILIGLFIWFFDYSGKWCDGLNLVNGRAIYHYLASIAIYLYYLFYRQFGNYYKS